MTDFKLPDVGEGIAEGQLLEWLVAVGDTVEEGQTVAEVSTDKVTVELPSPRAGTISELCWEPGDVVPVGEVLLRFAAEDAAQQPATQPAAAQPTAQPAAQSTTQSTTQATEAAPAVPPASAPADSADDAAGVYAAPSVRRYAQQAGVDLRTLPTPGSGHGGLLSRADVDAGLGARAGSSASGPRRTAQSDQLIGVRAASAANLVRSRAEQVLCTTTFRVEASGIRRLVERLAPEGERRETPVGPLAVIAAACAAALQSHPRLNATVDASGQVLEMSDGVHLGIAVATDHGLVVPVVHDAQSMRIFQLAGAIRSLGKAARERRVTREDLSGGTFSISSTGGIERADIVSTTPVTVFPQVAILWVSRIVETATVVDGSVAVVPMLTASLTFDHRFVDGLEATEFINDLAVYLRDPERAL